MITNRREVMAGGLAALAAAAGGVPVWAAQAPVPISRGPPQTTASATGPPTSARSTKSHQQVVKYFSSEPQGTVVVDTINHMLYLIMENSTAIRYGVGVGREGFK